MEHLVEIAVFAAKTILIVFGITFVIGSIAYYASRGRPSRRQFEIEKLNNRYRAYTRAMQSHLLDRKQLKLLAKADKAERKKKSAAQEEHPKNIFLIDFDGDLRAHAVDHLREEITAILSVARPTDEVVVRIESPGGVVTGYGLAAAQLRRVRDRGIPLVACVDKVAASGGYMMACVADRILAAPFAVVGSVGVVAGFANVHRLLEKNNIDYREVTAGEFKRTVSVFGEITPDGFEKFKSQIQDTHVLFKEFVHANRPRLNVDQIATGEYWYGTQALRLQLVDELITSDDYLWKQHETANVLRVRYQARKHLTERLSESLTQSLYTILHKALKESWLARFGL